MGQLGDRPHFVSCSGQSLEQYGFVQTHLKMKAFFNNENIVYVDCG